MVDVGEIVKQPEFTLEELTVIATAIMYDLEDPTKWHYISKPIGESILEKIRIACRPPDVTPTD